MTTQYAPVIIPKAEPNVVALQDALTHHQITHVKDVAGNVYRIFDRLNKKSVPLNHSGDGPPRIPYDKVESFGTMTTTDTEIDILGPDNLERSLLQQAVIKELKKIADDDKGMIHHALANGEKRSVRNARGAELGSIYRTSPKAVFVIEDMAAVAPMADESEIIDLLPSDPDTEAYAQAVRVLEEHAPHLLTITLAKGERDRLAEEVEEQWKITGQLPTGWGIQQGRDGYTVMRPNQTGKKIAGHLLGQAKNVLALTEGNTHE